MRCTEPRGAIKYTGSGVASNLVTTKSTQAPFTTNAKGRAETPKAAKIGVLSAALLEGHVALIGGPGTPGLISARERFSIVVPK